MSSTSQQRTSFLHIGADCAQLIAAFLNTKDHFSLARTNKNLYEVCRHKLSWYHLDLTPPTRQSLSLLQTVAFTSLNLEGYIPAHNAVMLDTCDFSQVQVLRLEENTLHRLVKEHGKAFASVRRLTINFNCTVVAVGAIPSDFWDDIMLDYVTPTDRFFSSLAGIRQMKNLQHLELLMHDGYTDNDRTMATMYNTVQKFMAQGCLPDLKSIIVRNVSIHAPFPFSGAQAAHKLTTLHREIWETPKCCILYELPQSQ
jgi:hypothetical protein